MTKICIRCVTGRVERTPFLLCSLLFCQDCGAMWSCDSGYGTVDDNVSANVDLARGPPGYRAN